MLDVGTASSNKLQRAVEWCIIVLCGGGSGLAFKCLHIKKKDLAAD